MYPAHPPSKGKKGMAIAIIGLIGLAAKTDNFRYVLKFSVYLILWNNIKYCDCKIRKFILSYPQLTDNWVDKNAKV